MAVLTPPNGFAAAAVPRVVADSRGVVWFPHGEGLTRYGPNGFQTFARGDGLPGNRAADVIQRSDGKYWIAVEDHLCEFDPHGGAARFRCESPGFGEIQAILDAGGVFWLGTDRGLWRRQAGKSWMQVPQVRTRASAQAISVRHLMKDSRGDVWAGCNAGLFRFRRDGRADQWTSSNGLLDDHITVIAETPGTMWVGTQLELLRLEVSPDSGEASIAMRYGRSSGLPSAFTVGVCLWENTIWAATFQGLARLLPSGRWQPVELDQSIRGLPLEAMAVDSQGALWLRTDGGGVAHLAGLGLSRFTESDGLPIRKVWAIMEDRNGDLTVVTKDEEQYAVNRFDGFRFHSTSLVNPFGTMWGWSWSHIAVQSKAGDWWLATSDGLLHYTRGLRSRPTRAGREVGFPHGNVSRIFEQKDGHLWANIYQASKIGILQRDPVTGLFRSFDERDGLPSLRTTRSSVSCFAEDAHGQLWLGLHFGGLLRFRNGRFEQFSGVVPGAPENGVRALLVDRRGRLWIGTMGEGLLLVENPAAERPAFTVYGQSGGLALNSVLALAEDTQGRIYAAGAGAINRLDPGANPATRIARFTTADGVIPGRIRVAFRDRRGALWFGGDQGLSRLIPREDSSPDPSVSITSIRVNGSRMPISDLGEVEPASLALDHFQRQIQVEFGGLQQNLRFQTRLTGVDADWTEPTSVPSAHYSSLAPGSYEFLVRPVAPNGRVGSKPAKLRFSIAAPVWLRWWFIALASAALTGFAYWVHRFVLERRLAIERTRSHIATELHDEVGSSLARISVLSDVLRSRHADGRENTPVIDQISTSARDVIEKMNDIVWAIDPHQDGLPDVVARIRRFASDVLDAKGIEWSFHAPPASQVLNLSLDQRRHLLLIFKEAIHNLVRHSGCRSVELRIDLDRGELHAAIKDDGGGLPANAGMGRGLNSMRNRAVHLGGSLTIASAPGQGTDVRLRFPLRRDRAAS